MAKARILLASQDTELVNLTRRDILEKAGYRTEFTDDLHRAFSLALDHHPDLVILGHSLSPIQQGEFAEALHESLPGMHLLCLREGITQPTDLLQKCKAILSGHPGRLTVHVLDMK